MEFLLTKDTSNIKNLKYKMISEIFKIFHQIIVINNIYDVKIPKVFILSHHKNINIAINAIQNVYYENDRFNLINYVNQKIIEMKLLEIEEIITNCEMNVEKLRALNNIIPENFPKDIYDIIYAKNMLLISKKCY